MRSNFSKQMNMEIDSIIDQIPGYFLLKDMDSMFLKGCKKVTAFFGFKHPEEIVGLTDYAIKHEIAKYGDMFVSQDRKLKLINKPISGYYVIPEMSTIKVLMFNKSLLKDKKQNNVGIITYCTEVSDLLLSTAIIKLSKIDSCYRENTNITSYTLNNQYYGLELSKRQSQCLFYLVLGKSASSIAKILALSKRTVESYIEEIKNKMSCNSKSDLIEKAIENSYLEIIPYETINK